MVNPNRRRVAGVRGLQPFQSGRIEVVGGDPESRLVRRGNLVSPSTHANAGGAQRIECTYILARFDQPVVLQRVGQQQNRPRPSRRHSGVQKTRSGPFRWPSRHVGGPLLIAPQVDEGSAFHPQMAVHPL